MGFEHERIHLETSAVLIRQLPAYMVSKPQLWNYAPFKSGIFSNIFSIKINRLFIQDNNQIISNEMIRVPETDVRLGKDFDFPSYGWDNEYGRVDCR
jgi:hypothetical protein